VYCRLFIITPNLCLPSIVDTAFSCFSYVHWLYYVTGDKPTMPQADELDHEAFDEYLDAQVVLPYKDIATTGTVIARKKDCHGNVVGKSHPNPVLDTRVMEVQFPDGNVQEFAANVIAEHLYSQVDDEGRRFRIVDEIIDHRMDGSAVAPDDMYYTDKHGVKRIRRTTKGWALLLQWKDGSTTWFPLRDLKDSNPIEVAKYAIANKLLHEPAFAWWVPDVLQKRDCIISAVKTRYLKRTHKFGICMPKSVKQALEIDRDTNTLLWLDAIKKEMTNVMPAFTILDQDAPKPVAHTWIPCHMIFDIKMDFTRKARFIAGGHVTDPPSSITYDSVVLRDSVRIALLIASLNSLDILGANWNPFLLQLQKPHKKVIFEWFKE
jgi:hypothetical protein